MTEPFHLVGNWLYHFFGIQGSGPWYGAWSGSLSDIGELAILGGVAQLVRNQNCQSGGMWPRGCWRHGKYLTADGMYRLCHAHHPDVPTGGPSLEHIHAAHAAAKAKSVKPPAK